MGNKERWHENMMKRNDEREDFRITLWEANQLLERAAKLLRFDDEKQFKLWKEIVTYQEKHNV